MSRLRELSLSGCTELAAPAIGALVRRVGARLERLELEGCFAVDPEMVALIGTSCSRGALRTLNLAQCYKVCEHLYCMYPKYFGLGDVIRTRLHVHR